MGVAMVLSQVGFSSLIQTQTNVQERSPLAVIGTMPYILLLGCFVDCCTDAVAAQVIGKKFNGTLRSKQFIVDMEK